MKSLIRNFLDELGLKLEWYKYMTSTGKEYLQEVLNLEDASKSLHKHMSLLLRQYLEQRYDSHYVLTIIQFWLKKEL